MEEIAEAKALNDTVVKGTNWRQIVEAFLKANEGHIIDTEVISLGRGNNKPQKYGPRVAPHGARIQVSKDGWVKFPVHFFLQWLRGSGHADEARVVTQVFSRLGIAQRTAYVGNGTPFRQGGQRCYEFALDALDDKAPSH